jgi:hypothetical protein
MRLISGRTGPQFDNSFWANFTQGILIHTPDTPRTDSDMGSCSPAQPQVQWQPTKSATPAAHLEPSTYL